VITLKRNVRTKDGFSRGDAATIPVEPE